MSNASHHTESDAPQHAASADKADAAVELRVHNNTTTPETGTQLADSRDPQSPDVDNNAPTKRTKLVVWAVGGVLTICAIVFIGWYMRRQVPVKPSERRISPVLPVQQNFGPNSDSLNNANKCQIIENILPKSTELNSLKFKNQSSGLSTETAIEVDDACKDYTLVISFVKQALEWNSKLLNIIQSDSNSFWYKSKPFTITSSVFRRLHDSDEIQNALDNGFAVRDAMYSLNQKAEYHLFVGPTKSEFDWKHLYTFYSILEKVPELIDDLTWIGLFGLEKIAESVNADILSIVQQLFGCIKNGQDVKGKDMILAVLESDLYNVIVTMFAKAADIFTNQLYVKSKSMTKIYYAWFHEHNVIRMPSGNFRYFTLTTFAIIFRYLSFINDEILADIIKSPNLKTVLHITLIFSSFEFDYYEGKSSKIVIIKESTLKMQDGKVKFSDLITNIRKDVPCWPDTDQPILPDLKEEISFKNNGASA